MGGDVAGGDVAKGYSRHLLGQQEGDGLAGDLAGADDHALCAAERHAGGFDQFHGGQRGAGGDKRVSVDHVPDVSGVHPLDVLHRVDLVLELGRVEVFGERQVEHDAGDRDVLVQAID